MAQFDVYRVRNKSGYFLSLQCDLLSDTATTVIAPLRTLSDFARPIGRLNPAFTIGDHEYVLVTHSVGTVPNEILTPTNLSLASERHHIIAALDFLFTGV